MKLSKTPGEIRFAPPTVGQHTNEILIDVLGFTNEDIVKLREERAVV